MSMSGKCTICFQAYGFLRKELACPVCRHSVCNKCVDNVPLMSNPNAKVLACRPCARKMEKAQQEKRAEKERREAEETERKIREIQARIDQKKSEADRLERMLIAAGPDKPAPQPVQPTTAPVTTTPIQTQAHYSSTHEISPSAKAPSPSTHPSSVIKPRFSSGNQGSAPPPLPPRLKKRQTESGGNLAPSTNSPPPAYENAIRSAENENEGKETPEVVGLVLPSVPTHGGDDAGDANASREPPTIEELTARLQQLKKEPQKDGGTSVQELADRISKMTNRPTVLESKPVTFAPDNRTDEEKIKDLISEASEHARLEGEETRKLDEMIQKIAGMVKEERDQGNLPVALLSGGNSKEPSTAVKPQSEEDKIADILRKAKGNPTMDDLNKIRDLVLAEREKRQAEGIFEEEDFAVDPDEEYPWCCLCNDDAIYRCEECDGELFCRPCFKSVHEDEDMRDHRPSKYRPPSTNKHL